MEVYLEFFPYLKEEDLSKDFKDLLDELLKSPFSYYNLDEENRNNILRVGFVPLDPKYQNMVPFIERKEFNSFYGTLTILEENPYYFYKLNSEKMKRLILFGYVPSSITMQYLDKTKSLRYETFLRIGILQGIYSFTGNDGKLIVDDKSFFEIVSYLDDVDYIDDEFFEEYREYLNLYDAFYPNYSKKYIEIYEREKEYRYLNGFDYLIHYPFEKNISERLDIKILREFIKYVGLKMYLAGGSLISMIKGINVNDYDFFIVDENFDINKIPDFEPFVIEVEGKRYTVQRQNHTSNKIPFFIYKNIETNKIKLKIDIITRLYRSPSEIIHGFDVDCSCILYDFDSNKIFITERCQYALNYQTNTVNFDRLSPSYEHRLCKYRDRGFKIYIPQYEYFFENVSTLKSEIPKKGSGIIIRKFLYGVFDDKISDYSEIVKNRNKPIVFKTLNPSEQTINTFNRIIMKDFKDWYPKKLEEKEDLKIPYFDETIFEITDPNFARNKVVDRSFIYPFKRDKGRNYFTKDQMVEFFEIIESYGDKLAIIGDWARFKFFDDEMVSTQIKICLLDDVNLGEITYRLYSCFAKIVAVNIRYWRDMFGIFNTSYQKFIDEIDFLFTLKDGFIRPIISSWPCADFVKSIKNHFRLFFCPCKNLNLGEFFDYAPLNYDRLIFHNGKFYTDMLGFNAMTYRTHFFTKIINKSDPSLKTRDPNYGNYFPGYKNVVFSDEILQNKTNFPRKSVGYIIQHSASILAKFDTLSNIPNLGYNRIVSNSQIIVDYINTEILRFFKEDDLIFKRLVKKFHFTVEYVGFADYEKYKDREKEVEDYMIQNINEYSLFFMDNRKINFYPVKYYRYNREDELTHSDEIIAIAEPVE